MKKCDWRSFSEVLQEAPHSPGIYEIRTGRKMLKVGIGGNLLKRLKQHAKSSQARLKGRNGSKLWRHPKDVTSKGSILAKHLYFDISITKRYDLRTEEGRRRFLNEKCQVRFEETKTREAAQLRERKMEASKRYRYVGRVKEL